jgi:hypothetical protein
MRAIHWFFLVGVLLYVASLGLFVANAGNPPGPAISSVATVKQIMTGIVVPASNVVFQSVATIVSFQGIEERAPRTADEWAVVEGGAAALVESGNLMMIGDRVKDDDDWMKKSQALVDAALVALKAAEARDANALFLAGEGIDVACDSCHEQYQK